MNKTGRGALIALISFSLSLAGCRKFGDEDTRPAEEAAIGEQCYNDVHNIMDEAIRTGDIESLKSTEKSGCFTISFDSTGGTHHVIVDFGDVNCLCADGRNRRGKILASFTGPYMSQGTVITITFDNYFVNDNQVLGTKTITNTGVNTSGNLEYDITINGSVVLADNGGTISFSGNKTREWLEGDGTANINDDVYAITGSGTCIRPNGTSVSIVVVQPLIRKMSPGCRKHFVEGILQVTPENKPVRTVDYGNGTCDNTITVTVNNHTFTITLQ